jgi:type IV pilus assembly protein PilM
MFQDNNLIGIDIGTNSIKIVEINSTNGVKSLVTYGISRHNINLDGYWDTTKLRKISKIINDILDSGGFGATRVMIGIRSEEVYVTTMDFDLSATKKEISSEIDKQAKFFLPLPPDEMRLSWNIIEDDPRIQAYTNKQRVCINAAPEYILENNRNLLEHINLDGVGLENQTISQIRSVLGKDVGNTILIDLGSKHTTFSFVVDGVLRSSHSIGTGGEWLTKQISNNLGINYIVSENLKKDLAFVNLFSIPKPILDYFIIIRSELDQFIASNRKISQIPAKIVATGGGIHLTGMVNYFKDYHTPLFIANPEINLRIDPDHRDYAYPVINQLSTAIGLASKEV